MTPSTPPSGYLLTKVAQAITARYAEALAPLGIRPKHYGVLAAVASMPAGSQQQLGQALGVVPSAVVSMLDDLQGLGAVARTEQPQNRRQFVISLTDTGRKLLERATEAGVAVDRQMLAALSPEQRQLLDECLLLVGGPLGVLDGGQ